MKLCFVDNNNDNDDDGDEHDRLFNSLTKLTPLKNMKILRED